MVTKHLGVGKIVCSVEITEVFFLLENVTLKMRGVPTEEKQDGER